MRFLRPTPFLLALGFLTRMGPSLLVERRDMSDSCFWYPVVGALLGGILAASAYAVFHGTGSPWVAAWAYVLLGAWLTRALHFDGLADVADALGSGKTGEAFHAVLKDSRIGAFGCMALVLAVSGLLAATAACIENNAFPALFFAPVLGRSLPLLFTAAAPPHPAASLGAIVSEAPALPCRLLCLAAIIISGPLCLGFAHTGTAILLSILCLLFLARTARREGGYNGDFFGALIICGECAALLAAL